MGVLGGGKDRAFPSSRNGALIEAPCAGSDGIVVNREMLVTFRMSGKSGSTRPHFDLVAPASWGPDRQIMLAANMLEFASPALALEGPLVA